MTKTQFLDALRNIKNRLASFLSIVLIIGMGTGVFFDLIMLTKTFTDQANDFYNAQSLKNYDLVSNVGVVDSDLEKIRAIEGVENAEGVIQLDGSLSSKSNDLSVKIISLTKQVSVPKLEEGRLPISEDECVINYDLYVNENINLNDIVSITSTANLDEDPLKAKKFKVVGIVRHPEFTRSSDTWAVVLNKSAFNMEALNNSYTNAFVRLDRQENNNTYADKYYKETKEVDDKLWKLVDTLQVDSKERFIKQSEEEIQKQLKTLYESIEEAENEIDENEQLANSEIAKARRQLADAKAKLADAYKQIEEGRAAIASGEADLAHAKDIYGRVTNLLHVLSKDGIIEKLNELKEYIDFLQEVIDSGDATRINEIKQKINNFLNNEDVQSILKLIDVFTDTTAEEIIDRIKNGKELDIAKVVIDKVIEGVEKNADFFDNITVENIIAYLEKLKVLVEKYKYAVENLDELEIAEAYEAIKEFLSEGDTNLAFKIIEAFTGIDINELIENIENNSYIEDNIDILIGYIDTAKTYIDIFGDSFIDMFSKESLKNYVNQLNGLINIYKQAIKGGVQEQIDNAKEALEEFFDRGASVVIKELIVNYTDIDINALEEEIDTILQGDVVGIYADLIVEELDEVITYVNYLDMFTADNVKSTLDLMVLLTNNYLNNQEETVKQELLDFLHDDDNEALFETLFEITGYDLRDYDSFVEQLNIDKLQYLISLANQLKDYIDDNPELFTSINKDEILKTLTDLKDAVSTFSMMESLFGPDDIEELKGLINTLLSKDAYLAIKNIIKIKTGVDINYYINLIYSGIFIDFGQIYLNFYLNELIDNSDFLDELSKEDVLNILNTVENYLNDIKEAISTGRQDLIDIAIKALNDYLGTDKVKFVIELLEKYLKEKFELIIDKIYSPEDMEMILIIINGSIEGFTEYLTLPEKIANGEATLAAGKAQLEQALKEYNDARKLLANKELELIDGEADAKEKISDARRQLLEKQEEAIEKIEKVREEIKNKHYNWIVQGRDAAVSFVLLKSSIQGTASSGAVFGSLFLFIIALVSFSTIAIIVEEEKRSVGTTKAFGFYNREILGKYLIFGVTGSILGVLLGLVLGFALCNYVLADANNSMMFTIGTWITDYSIPAFVAVGVGIVLLNVIATFLACSDLLKSPAALLMKGDTIASRNRKQNMKDKDHDSKGSLYSKLIIRNMFNEKARVLTSIFIIAASCFMIGVGFSITDGFMGMYNRQASDIYKYDFKIQYNENITQEEKNDITRVLNNYGTKYLDARYSPFLYENDHNVSGIYLLTSDNRIQDFVSVTDNKNNKIVLPDDGLLVQSKMYEVYDVKDGDFLHLYNTSLDDFNAQIKGGFKNYNGRFAICSNEAYRKIFNEDPTNNTMFVLLNGADYEVISKELLSLSDSYTIEKDDNYKLRLESSLSVFYLVVIIITGIAIVMSFMILTNLANIFFARKKNELIVMRINGFTIKQTKQYLIKETIITIIVGIVLGLILGYFMTVPIVKVLEQQDVMFVRDLDIKGWLIAIGVESIFAFAIYTLVFKKVEKLNFREIA